MESAKAVRDGGRVLINEERHSGEGDVLSTVVNESLSGAGARGALGDGYGAVLEDVFMNCSESARREISKLMPGAGMDYREATRRYLSALGERGASGMSSEERIVWEMAREGFAGAVSDSMLRGREGAGVSVDDASLARMLAEGRGRDGVARDLLGQAADVVRREDWHRENERGGGVRVEVGGEDNPDGGPGGGGPRFSLARSPKEFEETQRRAVAERGIVMPGLNDKEITVVKVGRHDFTGTGKEAIEKARAWAEENLLDRDDLLGRDSAGRVFRYEISKNNIKEYLTGKTTTKSRPLGVHLAVLKSLPKVIRNCEECEVHADMARDGNKRSSAVVKSDDLLVHRFYGAVDVDGVLYRVKVSMHESKDTQKRVRPYVYKVNEIEVDNELPTSTVGVYESTSSLREGTHRRISLAKLLQNVEKSYDPGKKILDESLKEDERSDYEDVMPSENFEENLSEGRNSSVGGEKSSDIGDVEIGDEMPRMSLPVSAPIGDRTLEVLADMHARDKEDRNVLNSALAAFGKRLRDVIGFVVGKGDIKTVRDVARDMLDNDEFGFRTARRVEDLIAAVDGGDHSDSIREELATIIQQSSVNGSKRAQMAMDNARAKNIAKTARAMMSGELIDGPGKREVSRLLSAASNAVGARHLTAIADKLMDIVIDNQSDQV